MTRKKGPKTSPTAQTAEQTSALLSPTLPQMDEVASASASASAAASASATSILTEQDGGTDRTDIKDGSPDGTGGDGQDDGTHRTDMDGIQAVTGSDGQMDVDLLLAPQQEYLDEETERQTNKAVKDSEIEEVTEIVEALDLGPRPALDKLYIELEKAITERKTYDYISKKFDKALSNLSRAETLSVFNGAGDTRKPNLIILASNHNHSDMVRYLIEKGAKINSPRDHEGNTALMIAAKLGFYDITRLLLENGAIARDFSNAPLPKDKNLKGETAYQLACRDPVKNQQTLRILLEYGAVYFASGNGVVDPEMKKVADEYHKKVESIVTSLKDKIITYCAAKASVGKSVEELRKLELDIANTILAEIKPVGRDVIIANFDSKFGRKVSKQVNKLIDQAFADRTQSGASKFLSSASSAARGFATSLGLTNPSESEKGHILSEMMRKVRKPSYREAVLQAREAHEAYIG